MEEEYMEEEYMEPAEVLRCPYCGRTQDCHEDDELTAFACYTECEHCGKAFWYSVQVTREYQSRKDF